MLQMMKKENIRPYYLFEWGYFLLGVALTLILILSHTLLLNSLSPEQVPFIFPSLYIVATLVSTVIQFLFDRLTDKFSLTWAVKWLMGVFFLGILLFQGPLSLYDEIPLYGAFLVFAIVLATVSLKFFHSMLGDYFDLQKDKDIYNHLKVEKEWGSFWGAVGLFLGLYFISPTNLLLFVLIATAMVNYLIYYLYSNFIPYRYRFLHKGEVRISTLSFAGLEAKFILCIFFISLLSVLFITFAGYQVLSLVRQNYKGQELGIFLSLLFGAKSLCWLLLHTLQSVTGRLDVMKSLFLAPLLLLILCIGAIWYPGLFMISLIAILFTSMQGTYYHQAFEFLFVSLTPRLRILAHFLIDRMITPLGIVVGSTLFLTIAYYTERLVIYNGTLIILSVAWIGALYLLYPHYKEVLGAFIKKLITPHRSVFSSNYAEDSVNIAKLLELKQYSPFIANLLTESEESVKLLILNILPDNLFKVLRPVIEKLVASSDAQLASTALKILGKLGDYEVACSYLNDPRPEVLVEALVACFKNGGDRGQELALRKLELLLTTQKLVAAKILRQIEDNNYLEELKVLLADEDDAVRQEAILATKPQLQPEMIPNLMENYQTHRKLRPAIREAFSYCPEANPTKIITLFINGNYPPPVRAFLLRIMGKIVSQETPKLILQAVAIRESQQLIGAACEALRDLVMTTGGAISFQAHLDETLVNFYEDLVILKRGLQAWRDTATKSLLQETIRYYIGVYLILLSLRYGLGSLTDIPKLLFVQEKDRADSWEMLKKVLPKERFMEVKTLLEPSHEGEEPAVRLTSDLFEKLLLIDPWIRSLCLYYAQGEKHLGEQAMTQQDSQYFAKINTIIFLKKMEFFKDIPANSLIAITEIVHEETFYPGEVIVKEGEPGNSMFLVCNGHISVLKNGQEIANLGPGESIGEMSLLDQLPRSATVVAKDQVQLLQIYADDFNEILLDYPEIAGNLLRILSRRLRHQG